jgi:hypothetical protein
MRRILIGMTLLVVVAPLLAVPEPPAEEVQSNRRRFAQLRKHPEVVAKLREDSDAFYALTPERRKAIVQIHKELHQESSATQARLLNVLDHYVDWLHGLDEATRKQIADAPDKNARLALIKNLREKEWIKDQPKAIQDKLAQLQGDARKAFIAKEKNGERQRKIEWQIAGRFWKELESGRPLPAKFSELSSGVQGYVQSYLQKMFLSAEEKDQLAKLEGQWPQYPMKLVELADKHPAALPGPIGPKNISELPAKLYNVLLSKAPKKITKEPAALQPAALARFLTITATKWPEFGIELARAAKRHGIVFEHEFLAYSPDCLTIPMQEFIKIKLKPVLDGKESLQLAEAITNGKWPEYPQTIQDLADNHHLRVPWFTLPREVNFNWDNYRLRKIASLDGFPDVPEGRLRDFALFELDAKERAKLHLTADDPDSKRRLAEEFFRKKQFELRRLRAADQNRPRLDNTVFKNTAEKGE